MTLTSFTFGLVTPETNHRVNCSCLCTPPHPVFMLKNVFLLTIFAWSGLPLSFLCAERWIRRVLDRKEQVKRDGSVFGFLLLRLGFFQKNARRCRPPLPSGSWDASSLAKSGRLSWGPKPRNSPTSTSRTSAMTWMTSG